jgi:hypothetical protein
MIRVISTANCLYSLLTLVIVFVYMNLLTTIGIVYFTVESIIIFLIGSLEFVYSIKRDH